MSRRPLIVGNWKMHLTSAETTAFVEAFLPRLGPAAGERDIVLAPPSTSLHAAASALAGSGVLLAAQNSHWEEEGPYTGEISPRMLEEIGCRYVIVGHSERRSHFGETDRRVNQKVRAILRCGMTPIVCVGEQSAEKASGRTREIVDAQLTLSLANIRLERDQRLVVAYEPVWAIGTGRNASPGDAVEVHRLIRSNLAAAYGSERADAMRILYGGSVSAANAGDFISAPGIDGVLVGGASLDPETFSAICRAA